MSIAKLPTYKDINTSEQLASDYKGSLASSGAIYQAESMFISHAHQPFALGVPNATLGLLACWLALEIKNAEIVTTPYTWGGSLSGLLLLGNKPVFCDIDPVGLTLDPSQVRQAITKKTKAILAVDIYGNPCDAFALRSLADEFGLWLIQDCAQSLGAELDGKQSGWVADVSVYSFSAGKALDLGDGGMICTGNQKIYDRLVWFTQHPHRQKRDVPHLLPNEFALNMRMSSSTAQKFYQVFHRGLRSITQYRDRIFKLESMFSERLGIERINDNQRTSSYHRWTIDSSRRGILAKVKNLLSETGITVGFISPPITRPLYNYPVFRSYWTGQPRRCREAEKQAQKRVRLIIRNINPKESLIPGEN